MNLRERREKLKLTQTQVANLVGIGTSTYNNYELGLKSPSLINSLLVADALGVKTYEEFRSLWKI